MIRRVQFDLLEFMGTWKFWKSISIFVRRFIPYTHQRPATNDFFAHGCFEMRLLQFHSKCSTQLYHFYVVIAFLYSLCDKSHGRSVCISLSKWIHYMLWQHTKYDWDNIYSDRSYDLPHNSALIIFIWSEYSFVKPKLIFNWLCCIAFHNSHVDAFMYVVHEISMQT